MNIENTFKLNDLKQDGSLTAIRVEGPKKSIDQRITFYDYKKMYN